MDTSKSSGESLALSSSLEEEKHLVEGKEKYKELKELLLLHRRYELEALRNLRKGVSVEANGKSMYAHGKINPREHFMATRSAILLRRKLSGAFNNDYMACLCAGNQTSALDQAAQEGSADPFQVSSSARSEVSSSARASVRLPSLVGRTFPRKPSRRKISNSRPRKEYVKEFNPPILASQMCLKVRSLSLIDQDKFVREHENAPKTWAIEDVNEEHGDPSAQSTLWLLPWTSEKDSEMSNNNSLPKADKNLLSTSKSENIRGQPSKKKGQLKYKKNVQFDTEAIHEIHLYSPMSIK